MLAPARRWEALSEIHCAAQQHEHCARRERDDGVLWAHVPYIKKREKSWIKSETRTEMKESKERKDTRSYATRLIGPTILREQWIAAPREREHCFRWTLWEKIKGNYEGWKGKRINAIEAHQWHCLQVNMYTYIALCKYIKGYFCLFAYLYTYMYTSGLK